MRRLTKRILELATLVALLLVFHPYVMSFLFPGTDSELAISLSQDFNRYWWDRNGPGVYRPYLDTFSLDPYVDHPEYKKVFDAVECARVLGLEGSLTATSGAPFWFHSLLDETHSYLEVVEKTISQGPFLLPPDDPASATPIFRQRIPNFMQMQITSKCLNLLASREWMEGNSEKATQYIQLHYRLADSLGNGSHIINHIFRVSLAGVATGGLAELVLADPQDDVNQMVLRSMGIFLVDSHKYQPNPALDAIAGSTFILAPASENEPRSDFGDFNALGLLLGRNADATDDVAKQISEIMNLPPREDATFAELRSTFRKWTPVLSMRKRINRVPESLFVGSDEATTEMIRRIPRTVYVCSRMMYQVNGANILMRLTVMRNAYHCTKSIYKARIWREEYGEWPNSGTFGATIADGTALEWHMLQDPERFVNQYVELLRPTLSTVLTSKISEEATSATLTYQLPTAHIEQRNIPSHGQYVVQGNIPAVWFPKDVDASDEMLESWVRAIFSRQPLVESITNAPDRKLNIHLRIPKTTYWVTHPGPDGVADGPGLSYDPTNGTVSAGDIVQLAGWE